MSVRENDPNDLHPAIKQRRHNTIAGLSAIAVGLTITIISAQSQSIDKYVVMLCAFLCTFGGLLVDKNTFKGLIDKGLDKIPFISR